MAQNFTIDLTTRQTALTDLAASFGSFPPDDTSRGSTFPSWFWKFDEWRRNKLAQGVTSVDVTTEDTGWVG